MPYQAGRNLPGEYASKLGHLEVLNSRLVNQVIENFKQPEAIEISTNAKWEPFPSPGQPLDLIFAVDGSWQPVTDERPPYKSIAFIKTALMKVDQTALGRIDKDTPHPLALRDLMTESALYHATALPLRYIYFNDLNVYDGIRQIIFESLKDASLEGELMKTLKWIAYEKWIDGGRPSLPPFRCPYEIGGKTHETTLEFDAEEGICEICKKRVFITDMLGFHLEMNENAASESVAAAYMNIAETLLLFTGVRYYWENNRELLKRCLFLKDGPLQIRAQYSKLVNPIRNFLMYAHSKGFPISILGQEKTGTFVDHLNLVGKDAPSNHLFVPDHAYICEKIQGRPSIGSPYGRDTNYGAKVFVILNERCRLVLNIPVCTKMGDFIYNPASSKLINLDRILDTLPGMISSRHENALIPIELANSIASLSTYPSTRILKLFAEATMHK